jgi:hypothetical protein
VTAIKTGGIESFFSLGIGEEQAADKFPWHMFLPAINGGK